jgi:hypothetical protein
MELRRPKNCPQCGSLKVLEILYGRPTSEGMEAVERGEMILGGCLIMPGQPDWACPACGYQWFDAEDPVRIHRDKLLDEFMNDGPDEPEA